MKILLAGGSSGGPINPVLAVALEIRNQHPQTEFLFVGTKRGPGRAMVEAADIKFVTIAGAKWRRYFSLKNILEPFVLVTGFLQALAIVKKFCPDVVFSAGGFVAVPASYAAKRYSAKVVIHQQDARIGLANKLIAPIADYVTTAFEFTAKQFYSGSGLGSSKLTPKAEWVGNPVRPEIFAAKIDAKAYFHLHDELPILLVLGGATGSSQINKILADLLPDLVKAHQVVHQTGVGKNNIQFQDRNYHPYEIIPYPQYAAILKLAHLVLARAGLSTIAELSALSKAAIVIPMPGTHQEDNGKILKVTSSAVVLTGGETTSTNVARVINSLKFNIKRVELLSQNIGEIMPHDATARLAKIILKYGKE